MTTRTPRSSWVALGVFGATLFVSVHALPGPSTPKPAPTSAATAATAQGSAVAPAPSVTASASGTAAVSTEPVGRRTALVASLTLKVINPKDTREALQSQAKALGGFAVLVTDRELHLKLPPSTLSGFVEGTGEHGLVLDKSLERADLTLEIAKLESQLKSKRTILAELQGFFASSDVAATLQIESSMAGLVNELESVKGQLRVLYDRSDWAVVRIAFDFVDRERITDVTSPFDWLNTVNLDRFLSEF
jgi:hypothetical protein